MHDDEEGPSQEERDTATAIAAAPTMTITGLTPEILEHVISSHLERDWRLDERVKSAIDKQIEKAIAKGLEASAKSLTEEHMRPAVAELVQNGWRKTDNYGSATGATITLAQRLNEYLTGGRYSDSPVERIFREELGKALSSEAGKAFQAALGGLASKVDAELSGRITNAFKQAVGMK